MRFAWTFFAGLTFAALTMLVSAPLLVAAGVAAWLLRGETWTMLAGESFFAVRDVQGRTAGQMVNVTFRTVMVAMAGEMRPRRLLLRLEVRDPDVFTVQQGSGRVRLDAWALDDAADLRQQALYTVVAPGRAASIEPDGVLLVEKGARRSAYSLASGAWLFDADTPTAHFPVATGRDRYVAVAAADDDLPGGAIAVLTYASAHQPIRRLLLTAADPTRARILRTAVGLTRPVSRVEDTGGRVIELPLPAGTLRLPMDGDDLALARATIPAGLAITEVRPWK